MHAPAATWMQPRLWLCAFAFTWLLAADSSAAQQLQLNFGAPAPTELSPPRIELIIGPTASRLEQARALMQRPEISKAKTDDQKIKQLYRILFQRDPDRDELIALAAELLDARARERA